MHRGVHTYEFCFRRFVAVRDGESGKPGALSEVDNQACSSFTEGTTAEVVDGCSSFAEGVREGYFNAQTVCGSADSAQIYGSR